MKTILALTDFSDDAFNAVQYAAELAKEFNSTLHLLNVFHVPAPLKALPVEMVLSNEEIIANGTENFKLLADKLKETLPASIKVITEIRKGHIVHEVENYATAINADLIVVGLRGSGFLKEKIIGSTVTSLINRSKNSVLIIPHNARYRKLKKISFASDGENIAEISGVKIFFDVCDKFHPEISILNINVPGDRRTRDKVINHLESAFITRRHSYYFPLMKDVNEGIEEFIVEKAVDMLALIHRRHSLLEKLFTGSHSKKFAFHSHIPVLIIPDLNKEDKENPENEGWVNDFNLKNSLK